MKKLLLFLLVCVSAVRVQAVTATIYATGASGSFTTGNATSTTRTDGNIVTTSSTTRGYAVFNLASLPASAIISSVIIHFNIATYGGTGTPSGWTTYGYAGDLSTLTTAATLFPAMTSGTSLSTATYGTVTGNVALASTAASVAFITSRIGSKASISFTGGNNRIYTITGETGTTGTTGAFAPYLEITYCVAPSGVSATASPNPVCAGSTLTLTGAATGATSYSWSGPGSYSSVNQNNTLTAAAGSAGVYTFSATVAGCTYSVTTSAVTVLAAPAAITPATATSICVGSTVTLSDVTAGGTWTSTSVPVGVATVSATGGVVGGVSQGTALISYTVPNGCSVTKSVTVNAPPAAIVPASARVCLNSTTTLTNASTGGTWSSSLGSTASVVAATGVVTGNTVGTATITYNNGCGTAATRIITVDPLPASITGAGTVCPGATITLSDATPGGTWTSGAPLVATVGASTGIVTGVAASSTAIITYTSPLNCNTTAVVTTGQVPGPSVGVLKECMGGSTHLTNALAGGSWSSSAPSIASVNDTGLVVGSTAGTAVITYTTGCGFSTVIDTVVGIPPHFVGGNTMCLGADHVLANAVIGGTWTSSNTSVATIGSSSGVMHGNAVGYTLITYIVPPGCASQADTVKVLALPPAITGSTQTCPGQTTALADASPKGTWMSLSPGVASVGTTGVVTGLSADTALIVYTDTNGCKTSTIVTVNPNPLPIVGKNVLCATLLDTLSNASIGGVWSSVTPGIASVDANGIVTTIAGGTAVIRYTYPTTGCYAKKSITVNPLPAPAVTYNYFTNSFEATTGFVSYQWYNSVQGLVPGATYPTTAAIYDGTYYVVVTDDKGCVGASVSVPFNSSMLGVPTTGVVVCRVYPNPAGDMIHVDAPVKVNVVISDMTGKKEMEVTDAKAINISRLTPGLHMLSLYNDKGQLLSNQKLTKE